MRQWSELIDRIAAHEAALAKLVDPPPAATAQTGVEAEMLAVERFVARERHRASIYALRWAMGDDDPWRPSKPPAA